MFLLSFIHYHALYLVGFNMVWVCMKSRHLFEFNSLRYFRVEIITKNYFFKWRGARYAVFFSIDATLASPVMSLFVLKEDRCTT